MNLSDSRLACLLASELRDWLRLSGSWSPMPEVIGVEPDAEEVCGNESELGGAHPDDAKDNAVCARDDPAVPESLSQKNG